MESLPNLCDGNMTNSNLPDGTRANAQSPPYEEKRRFRMRTLLFAISGPLAGRHLARRIPYFVRNAHRHWWIIRVCAGNGDLRKHRNNRHPQTAALFPAAPGQTERPVRLQFMAGQVGLYIDVAYSLQRPDAKRPQALKSRVARAKRGESTPTALQTAPRSPVSLDSLHLIRGVSTLYRTPQ